MTTDTARREFVLILAIAIAGPLISVIAFGSTGRDDPYITFSAAEQFKQHLSIANINGEAYEQSTSFLFTVILAILSTFMPLSMFNLGWALGFLGLSAVGVLTYFLLRTYLSSTIATLGALILVTLPPLNYWAASGAEQSWVVAALIAVVMAGSKRSAPNTFPWEKFLTPILVLVAFLLRPDAGIAALLTLGLFALIASMPSRSSMGPWQEAAPLFASSLALIALVTVVRALLTGTFLPQSVMAKAQSAYEAWDWTYVITNAALPYFLMILFVAAVVAFGYKGRLSNADRQQHLLAFTAIFLLLILLRSGPDWMEAGRLWIPPAALIAIFIASRFTGVTKTHALSLLAAIVAVNVATIALWSVDTSKATFGVGLSGSNPNDRWTLVNSSQAQNFWPSADSNYNLWNAVHAKDAQFLSTVIPLIQEYLEQDSTRPITIAGGDAGMIFYFLKEGFGDDLEFIDRWSLISPSFMECPDVNRTPVGAGMSFGKWVQWVQEGRDCVPNLPDIIFDNDRPSEKELELYDLVFQQDGTWLRESADVAYSNEMWLAFKKP